MIIPLTISYIIALIIMVKRYKPAGEHYVFGDYCVIALLSIPLALVIASVLVWVAGGVYLFVWGI